MTWLVVVAVLALPWAVGGLARVVAEGARRRAPDPAVDAPAGPWAVAAAQRLGLGVQVGVTPEIVGPVDAFWPAARFLGLRPDTWVGQTAAARAIAAHELGHAWSCRRRGWGRVPELLRLTSVLAGHTFGAALLVGVATGASDAWWAARVALGAALVLGLGVLADEGLASLRGRALLERESAEVQTAATRAFVGSWGTYAASWATLLGLWLTFDLWSTGMGAPGPPRETWVDAASFVVLFGTPFLLTRAGLVLWEVGRRPPPNAFHLAWSLDLERTWELRTGMILLAWLALAPAGLLGPGEVWLAIPAMVPLMAPLTAFGRAIGSIPFHVFASAPGRSDVEAAEADVLIPARTDLLIRLGSLVRLGFLPLWLVMLDKAVPVAWWSTGG